MKSFRMSETIYVRLVEEDIEVWRPVLAIQGKLSNQFTILPPPTNVIPEGEFWEFSPSEEVFVKEMILGEGIVKVAFKKFQDSK